MARRHFLNISCSEGLRASRRGRLVPDKAPARDGGREGLSPAKGRQEEWYRRVFASALSLGKEAGRFLLKRGQVPPLNSPSPVYALVTPPKAAGSMYFCHVHAAAKIDLISFKNPERFTIGGSIWTTTRPSTCRRPTSPCGRACPSGSRRCSSAGRSRTSITRCSRRTRASPASTSTTARPSPTARCTWATPSTRPSRTSSPGPTPCGATTPPISPAGTTTACPSSPPSSRSRSST